MSNDNDYDDDQDQDDGEQMAQLSVRDLRALRKKAKMADDLSPKQAQYERELGFLKAGIDADNPKMKYFVKAYDGDLTGEAIKAAAIEAGLVDPPQEQISPEELRQHRQMANASAGSDGDNNEPDIMEKIGKSDSIEEIMGLLDKAGAATTWNRPS